MSTKSGNGKAAGGRRGRAPAPSVRDSIEEWFRRARNESADEYRYYKDGRRIQSLGSGPKPAAAHLLVRASEDEGLLPIFECDIADKRSVERVLEIAERVVMVLADNGGSDIVTVRFVLSTDRNGFMWYGSGNLKFVIEASRVPDVPAEVVIH